MNRGRQPPVFAPSAVIGSDQGEVSRRNRDQFAFAVGREGQAGFKVFRRKVREIGQNFRFGHARSQIVEDFVNRNAHATNTGFPPALARLDRDVFLVIHKPHTRPGMGECQAVGGTGTLACAQG